MIFWNIVLRKNSEGLYIEAKGLKLFFKAFNLLCFNFNLFGHLDTSSNHVIALFKRMNHMFIWFG